MKKTNPRNTQKRSPKYLKTARKENGRNISFNEEALYKPFLIMFALFIFVMIVVFPDSIFDNSIPEIMGFIRRLIMWMSLSAAATLLILPVSVFDIELLRIFSEVERYSNLFVIFVVAFAVFSDTLFAFVGYRFTKTLRRLFARKVKEKDSKKSNEKLNKYGNYGMFLFACTPLPFTLAIYTAGAVRLNKRGFLAAVAAGRAVKYSAFALFLRLFGINLVEIGKELITLIFG